MAIWPATITYPQADDTVMTVTWGPMANGDSGQGVGDIQWSDRSVQVEGTFGSGGNVAVEGSNNAGVNYRVLNDAFGNALNFTAAAIKSVVEITAQIAPFVTAGDGTTSITVSMTCRRIQPLHNN